MVKCKGIGCVGVCGFFCSILATLCFLFAFTMFNQVYDGFGYKVTQQAHIEKIDSFIKTTNCQLSTCPLLNISCSEFNYDNATQCIQENHNETCECISQCQCSFEGKLELNVKYGTYHYDTISITDSLQQCYAIISSWSLFVTYCADDNIGRSIPTTKLFNPNVKNINCISQWIPFGFYILIVLAALFSTIFVISYIIVIVSSCRKCHIVSKNTIHPSQNNVLSVMVPA